MDPPNEVTKRRIEKQMGDHSRMKGIAVGSSRFRDLKNITVPVHVHVIQPSEKELVADDAMVRRQIQVLNESYSGKTGKAKTPFRFELAKINRVVKPEWIGMSLRTPKELEAKKALGVKNPAVLNFYVVKSDGTFLGWATFPWMYAAAPDLDGVVIDSGTLPGGTTATFNGGMTAVHEVGHWLGLYHTFQGSCEEANGGDQIIDTPPQQTPSRGCPVTRDSCMVDALNDPVHNYMDYSDDSCMNEFTLGQVVRMANAALLYRGL